MAEHLVEPGLDARRDRALEARRLLVRFGPAEADDRGQQPLQQRVAAEDAVGGRPARVGQDELASAGPADLGDETVRRPAGGTSRSPPGC